MVPERVSTAEPPRDSASSELRRFAAVPVLAVIVLAIDQTVKVVVAATLKNRAPVDLFGGLLRLDYTSNTGAAFGAFKSGGALLALLALAVSLGILLCYQQIARAPILVRIALGLILGGAVGNLIDRVRLGYVVDFLDLRWWPVFNIADSAIVIGAALLFLFNLLSTRRQART